MTALGSRWGHVVINPTEKAFVSGCTRWRQCFICLPPPICQFHVFRKSNKTFPFSFLTSVLCLEKPFHPQSAEICTHISLKFRYHFICTMLISSNHLEFILSWGKNPTSFFFSKIVTTYASNIYCTVHLFYMDLILPFHVRNAKISWVVSGLSIGCHYSISVHTSTGLL